ncbi:MAG: MFS transporter [Minwuia sp.]|nr:MFS transporter [Minwuia sp.]
MSSIDVNRLTPVRRAYGILTGDDEGRVCRDIPDSACHEQPRNFMTHVLSLSLTKVGDGLVDPKLVLAWLMTALGAPAGLIGFLVPVREAGALLPQLFISGGIRSLAVRKWVWSTGSIIQGLAVIGMGLVALTLQGAAAGWAIVGLLAIMATARSICSVSYKDVLGKTVSKSTRGTATGTAGSLASGAVLLFGLALSLHLLEQTVTTIAIVLLFAGGAWLLAGALFTTLQEAPGATEGGGNPFAVAIKQLRLLGERVQLRRFIVARGLLVATALAPPYLLAMAGESGRSGLADLGLFVIAAALASILGGYVWGRLSDRSSRKVLVLSGLLGAATLAGALVMEQAGLLGQHGSFWLAPLLFVLTLAYQGVRLGRSTHLVDMAPKDDRAAYTALANTIIGILLLGTAAIGVIAESFGIAAAIGVFAVMSLAGAGVALGLDEVQQDDPA